MRESKKTKEESRNTTNKKYVIERKRVNLRVERINKEFSILLIIYFYSKFYEFKWKSGDKK